MRKYLFLFLLVMMPLQLTWAAVASYCQHEVGAAAQHFSHHAHQHAGSISTAEMGATGATGATAQPHSGLQKSPASSSLADLDCMGCHASCAAALPPLGSLVLAPALSMWLPSPYRLHHSTPPPARRDRPQWASLARFSKAQAA